MPMTSFALSAADAAYLTDLARDKDQALALLDQCAALVANVPADNAFLAYAPLDLGAARRSVIHRFAAQVTRLLADHYQCHMDVKGLMHAPATPPAGRLLEIF